MDDDTLAALTEPYERDTLSRDTIIARLIQANVRAGRVRDTVYWAGRHAEINGLLDVLELLDEIETL